MAKSDISRRVFLSAAGATLASQVLGGVPLAPPDRQPPDLDVPRAQPRKAGFAIVGLGQLALEEVMPAFAAAKRARPVALVSGHPDKARAVAEHYGMNPKAIYGYDNFESIGENAEIDAVYIILPNSMHAEYTRRAVAAGKHVLCEKPMAANAAEAQGMIDAAKAAGRKLMIAYRLRYEPFNQTAIRMVRDKTLGELRLIEAQNHQDIKAPNIRLSRDLAGGPVQDVGIYCINAARYLTGEEPVEVSAMEHRPAGDERFAEVPASVSWVMRFPSGVLSSSGCGFAGAVSRWYRVTGTQGTLDLANAFAYEGQRLKTAKADEKTKSETITEHALRPVDHFAAEMDHFAECVLDGKERLTPGEEGLADMRVIDAIARSIREGKTVKV